MKEKEKKICTKCNEEKTIEEFYYNKTRRQRMNSCKKCNSKSCLDYQHNSEYRQTLNYIFYQRAYGIKRDNRDKVPVMDYLKEYLIELWEKQEGKCYYTGKKLDLSGYHANNYQAMTVDRIVPEKGYIKDNIALCCGIINRMKQNLSFEELKYWCGEIINSINKM